MKQLAILAFALVVGACFTETSWGQCHHHGGYYAPRTTISVGYGNYGYNNYGYNNIGYGYGYNPGYGYANYGYPGYHGYNYSVGYPNYYRAYSVPAASYYRPSCGSGGYRGGYGGGVYFRW